MSVHELRPPCECGNPSLTAFCPMTPRFAVLRAELTNPAAPHRRWLCGRCLLQAITALFDGAAS